MRAQTSQQSRSPLRWLAAGVALGIASYAAYVSITWLRYGKTRRPGAPPEPALDRFMPRYEIVECHSTAIAVPADLAFQAAAECGFQDSPIARAIFRARELLLGAEPSPASHQGGILAEAQSIGWGILDHSSGEIIMGAVTQPWEPNVVFHPLPPDEFATFSKPGFVKIAWTLRVDPTGPDSSVLRTETRVSTTDSFARSKFRRYWSLLSPGILLIRHAILHRVKTLAERRFQDRGNSPSPDHSFRVY